MQELKGYSDLNIPIGTNCQAVTEAAIKHGYVNLAINTPVLARNIGNNDGSGSKKIGKKRKWEERSGGHIAVTAAQIAKNRMGVPTPPSEQWMKDLTTQNPNVRIFQRLTVIFSDISELQATLSLPNAKLYDIYAVIPTNHDALQGCLNSTTINFDIISFDFEGVHWIQKLRINRQKGDLAAGKDVFFELTYASAIHGDTPLENLIYTANSLIENVCVKRVKNLIITSGASVPLELRSPKDLASLGFLLSLDEGTCRFAVREFTHRIIQKSDARRYGKTWVAFVPATS